MGKPRYGHGKPGNGNTPHPIINNQTVLQIMEDNMGVLKIEGVTHWSIPVDDLVESEEFYGGLLGLTPKGRLGNSVMSCINVGDHLLPRIGRARPRG